MEENDILNKYHHKFTNMILESDRDPELKNEVMSTISRIDSILEVIDLFSNKFVLSKSIMLDNMYKIKK